MPLTPPHHRLPSLILGCLTAALLATPLAAQVQIDYTNGQTDTTGYDTSAPNDPTTLSILSGIATQSGVLSGTGQVIKVGAGTLVLSGLNSYTGDTIMRAGTLQVVDGATLSQLNASISVADQSGDVARLLISGGTVGFGFGGGDTTYIGNQAGSKGTVDMSGGTWTYGANLRVGNEGTGVLNISGGSTLGANSSGTVFIGYMGGSSGTANVSGGTFDTLSLYLGYGGTGVLNISGGSVSSSYTSLGSQSGSSGTANVSGGTWTSSQNFVIGQQGTGVLNLTGGTVDNGFAVSYIGASAGGSGTANVSGGTWNFGSSYLGYDGTGVVNLTDTGIITVDSGSGTIYLGMNSGSSGTLNLGTGGAAGTLNAASIYGGSGTAVVNFNHTGSLNFAPTLTGTMTVNQIGPGTTTLTAANTYTGDTFVFGGTLELGFGATTSDILPTNTTLYLGSGRLLLTGEGTQTVFQFYTIGSGSIVLGQNQTLDLGQLGGITPFTALNFDTSAGGADGAITGSGIILLSGQTAGSVIHPTYTVTDSTGFGLATVNASNQIIRHNTDLLSASGATYSDYRIDNNAGDSTTAGSAALVVTSSQSVVSITVDTTAGPGVLTLDPGVVLGSSIWNFGSVNGSSHSYEITGGASGAGIQAATPGDSIQINNNNSAPVIISAPILANGVNSGLNLTGSGTTILTAVNTYLGSTLVYSGVLEVAAGASISSTGVTTTSIGSDAGSRATLLISGGSVSNDASFLGQIAGSSGTATVSSGSWITSALMSIGESGTGVLNISGGSVRDGNAILGRNADGSGTATVSGGTWTHNTDLEVGHGGTGMLNLSGGSVTSRNGYLASAAGSSGTANVSGGSWNNSRDLYVGIGGTGVLNLSGGTVSNRSGVLGSTTGSSGTANVSGGTWTSIGDFYAGFDGTGVLNLTDSGNVTVGGTLNLALHSGSRGTLNLGTGGVAGTLNTASILGGSGTAVVNFNHTGSYTFTPTLAGTLSVNHIGPGTTTLTAANTYTGTTSVLGGTLELGFGSTSANILPTTTDLTLGSSTLLLTGAGTQTVNSLSTSASGAGSIALGENQTLDLGGLGTVGSMSAVHFNTAAGGADGATVGSGVILLSGQTAGSAIDSSFTVSDATGFGLATVNGLNQIIRLTTSDLLPASGADSGTDYRIDNNSGGSTAAGSSSLIVTDSQTARSITVDTTAASGVLTLGSGAILSSDVWNFGGNGGNPFEITGSDSGAGITTTTAGGMLQINNYNAAPVTLSAPILDNGGSGLRVSGPGATVLSGASTYSGDTLVTGGALTVSETGSISSLGTTTIGSQTGDHADLSILGTVEDGSAVLGDAAGAVGTAIVGETGNWYNSLDLTVGRSGTGVLNINKGYVESSHGHIGVNAGSSGTVTVSNSGAWAISGDLDIGQNGTGALNIADFGIVAVADGHGPVTLGAQGTLNIGMGGSLGLLIAETVSGVSGAVVNYNYNLFNPSLPYNPVLTGDLAVNKLGSGYLTFDQQNTYTGRTTVNGGTLDLDFTDVTTDIISRSSALTLGGGTLNLYSEASSSSQTLNGLTTTAGTSSLIYLSPDVTLDLGALTSAGTGSALNFDLYEGGADGATVGTGIVLLSGQTAGSVINPGYTVTDSTGFGLATVNDLNQIIRLTSTDLLPDSGAIAGTDYLIDNNGGGNLAPGSSSLEITASQTARSITVDSTQSTGLLTLDAAAVLSSDVWNFGGEYDYEITGSDSGAGITTATTGGMLQINNFNYDGIVTISAPILDNGGSSLRVAGPDSLTILTGTDTYTGETIINNGTLFINGDHTAATGEIIVQSSAELAGVGQIGGNIHVLNGGILTPGSINDLGTLTGTTATFDTNSIFHVLGGGDTLGTLHLSGAVTIASGALLYIDTYDSLTQRSYTLMTADGGGLDGSNPFTLGLYGLPDNYRLEYDGTTLKLVYALPITAFWTGKVDGNWSSLSAGTSNWSTAVDGVTDTAALPAALTDVTFSATGVGSTQTNLDVDTTIYSLTINSDTSISTSGTQTLTVNNATAVNALLAINSGVTLLGKGDLTIATTGTLAGSGAVEMALNHSILVNGAISVGDPSALPGAQVLSLTTSGTGAIVMGAGSSLFVNLYTGAGLGDNTASLTAADQLSLHGTLNATAGGTLVIGNPTTMTSYAGGDQWKVIDLNGGAGTITGQLAVNDSSLGLATGFVGTFDQTTGIYSIADHRPELTAYSSGLSMANAEGQAIIAGVQTALNDVNNHLFNLRSGGGEEEEESDGSISAALDYGVVVGEGDGPENPIARRVKRSRQWEVFTTVNYGNVKLNPISTQSGVQIDSWASSVGIERHLSRGLTLGFAVTFLQSTQTYTGGLGKLDLEGPNLSAYLAYARKGFWGSLLYSFGAYDLGSQRNPGLGLPTADGATNAYTNAIQYNTGWNFHFLQDRSLVTGPFIGIDYLHGTVDAYSETGGGLGALRYGKQTFESLVTRVGWSTSKKFHTDWADITPQFRLSYERQNLKNNGTSVSLINAPFTAAGGNQSPGQDYMVLGTGVNFQFTPDFSMLLGYQVQLFRNNMQSHFGSVRFGYKF